MRTLIVDDDVSNIKLLEFFSEKYCPQLDIIGSANSVETALEFIIQQKPDLLFLDIELHDRYAMDILVHLEENPMQVILVTAYERYALEMYKYSNIAAYVLKPVDIKDFISAVHVATLRHEGRLKLDKPHNRFDREKYIALPELGGLRVTSMDEIIHLESKGNYTVFSIINGKKLTSSKSIKDYEELLPKKLFMRVHHSYMVNVTHVQKYMRTKNGSLIMLNGIEIPISASRKKEVTDRIVF